MKQGYYSGKPEDFSFSRAYAVYDFGALRGCDAREWSYYNRFADGMDKYLPWIYKAEGEVMPLWIKPNKPLSAHDMKWMMRDHFEGTPFDMTVDIGAGPFKVPYRWRPMSFTVDSVEYVHERAIATQQTGFSLVSSMNKNRPEAMKGILWFGVDDANTCVYVPIFNSMTKVPHCLEQGNGDMYNISWDAMFWVNNFVANQAYNRYSKMIPDIRKVQNGLESAIEEAVEKAQADVKGKSYAAAAKELQNLTDHWAEKTTKDYKQLGDYLLVKYLDGNVKKEKDGQFERNEYGVPVQPEFGGYDDERYFRSIVNETGDKLKITEIK